MFTSPDSCKDDGMLESVVCARNCHTPQDLDYTIRSLKRGASSLLKGYALPCTMQSQAQSLAGTVAQTESVSDTANRSKAYTQVDIPVQCSLGLPYPSMKAHTAPRQADSAVYRHRLLPSGLRQAYQARPKLQAHCARWQVPCHLPVVPAGHRPEALHACRPNLPMLGHTERSYRTS